MNFFFKHNYKLRKSNKRLLKIKIKTNKARLWKMKEMNKETNCLGIEKSVWVRSEAFCSSFEPRRVF